MGDGRVRKPTNQALYKAWDKVYDQEVNWRKLKLVEESHGSLGPAAASTLNDAQGEAPSGHGFLKRLHLRRKLLKMTGGTPRRRGSSSVTLPGTTPGATPAVSGEGPAVPASPGGRASLRRDGGQMGFDEAFEGAEGIMLSPPIDTTADQAEIDELVRDSPRFQNQLAEWDREAALVLEQAKKMVKSAEAFLRANEEAVGAGMALAVDVQKFGNVLTPSSQGQLADDARGSGSGAGVLYNPPPSPSDEGFQLVLSEWRIMSQELLILRTVLDEQLQATFVTALQKYFQSDVRHMRKQKVDYEAARLKYSTAMQRFLGQAGSLSTAEKKTAEAELNDLKLKVAKTGYELYQQVAAFRLERHLALLEYLFYFMSLHTSFFRHGYHTMKGNEGDVNLLREVVQKHRRDVKTRQENINRLYVASVDKAWSTAADMSLLTTLATEGEGLKKEGWLTKLSNSPGGLQRWKRKWFVLENGRLCYRKDTKTTDTKGNVDMLLTTVKLGLTHGGSGAKSSRAFTFELICASPQVHWQIQAESEQDKREWVHALQTVTANLLGISVPHAPAGGSSKVSFGEGTASQAQHDMGSGMSLLLEVPAFKLCAECDSPAEWASINLGITLCLECSGAHRSLGTHVTKVRSLAMDKWPEPLLDFMRASGNAMSRSVWERGLDPKGDPKAGKKAAAGGSPAGGPVTDAIPRPSGPGGVEHKKKWCTAK